MAFRAINVKVSRADTLRNKLVIEQKKAQLGKPGNLKTTFRVDPNAVITAKDNRSLRFSDVKAGNMVIVDFTRAQEGELLAKGITVLR
jgi:hypothetical protein